MPHTHALNRAAVLAALLAAAAPASAQTTDLSIDLETAALVAPGGGVTARLVGPPSAFALLAADVSPGPIVIFDQSVPLGATPALLLLPFNATDAGGTATWPIGMPANPSLAGLLLHFAGAVADASHPSGLRVSNGATLEVVDEPALASDQLAGRDIAILPGFTTSDVFQTGAPIFVALDAHAHPFAAGKTVDVYLVPARDAAQWAGDPVLVDASSDGVETVAFQTTAFDDNVVAIESGALPGSSGPALGTGYDVVIDVDRDGLLGDGDVIDGLGDETGLYVTPDLSLPGPYAVSSLLYNGPTQWLRQEVFYPSNVASLSVRPLVVVSHGNGHDYQWYDHLGTHLASWGFVVMSHRNNTVPGVQSAATTTLDNLDHFLGNLGTIAPALVGKVDNTRIGLIGHSRGGEGVVIAYHRLFTNVVVPANYSKNAIKVVSSIAPTYFEYSSATPDTIHTAPYHVWVGAADADVTGCGSFSGAQPMGHYGWAEGPRNLIQVQGAGHGAFHNGGGSTVSSGPCQLTRAEVHAIMRPHALALFAHYVTRDPAAEDFLVREWSEFEPLGAPATACAVVHVAHSDTVAGVGYVIDDFQTQTSDVVASSGAAVVYTVTDYVENTVIDSNDFTANSGQAFNSFTHGHQGGPPRAGIFSFGSAASQSLRYELPLGARDLTGYRHLAFMLAQGSRHVNTVALGANVRFRLRLEDGDGTSTTLRFDGYGDGVGRPYARTGCGTGAGWAAEFESFRVPLEDFARNGNGFDLANVRYVEFLFGSSHGSAQGRIAIDQVELLPE
jgi:hypothetical protein